MPILATSVLDPFKLKGLSSYHVLEVRCILPLLRYCTYPDVISLLCNSKLFQGPNQLWYATALTVP